MKTQNKQAVYSVDEDSCQADHDKFVEYYESLEEYEMEFLGIDKPNDEIAV